MMKLSGGGGKEHVLFFAIPTPQSTSNVRRSGHSII
jgi:hypothetical protein